MWDALASRHIVEDVLCGYERAALALERLRSVGAVVLAPPDHEGAAPDSRTRVLIFEAHMDDAVLSVGGTMLASRTAREFEVATVCGRSNFTSAWLTGHDLFDEDEVTRLRAHESSLAMRVVLGRHCSLGIREAPRRADLGAWTREWYRAHRKLVDEQIGHAPSPVDVRDFAEALEARWRIAEPDEVWLPLGIGSHTDHETLRSAWLRVLACHPELYATTRVCLYRDVPYLLDFSAHERAILTELERCGLRLTPRTVELTGLLGAKIDLASVYASQFKPHFIGPRIVRAAWTPVPGEPPPVTPRETRFEVAGLAPAPDPVSLYSGGPAVRARIQAVSTWIGASRGARRIRLVSADPLPRIEEDLALLLEVLDPDMLEVHVRADHLPGGITGHDERIRFRPVLTGRRGWLRRLARLAFAQRVPTAVVTGRGLWRYRAGLRFLGTGSRVVVTSTLSELVVAVTHSNPRSTWWRRDL
ncbi:MAG: hypothetical protein LC667_18000 [Thioalkalivibrio sp.]|nr:hypothetical protein [Thioalkalivibrio sp.]